MASTIGNRITEDSIVFSVDFSNRRSFAPNLLNYSVWITGSGSISSSSVYGTSQYTDKGSSEDTRIIDVDPFGNTYSVVWSATSVDDAIPSGDGGWDTGNFPVDPSKLYRFSVWTKRSVFGAGTTYSGEFYHGVTGLDTPGNGHALATINPGITQSNAYFFRTLNSDTSSQTNINPPYLGGLDVWTLVVGHVWPFNTATGSRYDAGGIVTSKTATVNSTVTGGFVRSITNISIKGDLTSQLSAGTWFYFTYNVRSFDGLVITAASWSGTVLSSTWNSGTNVTTVTPDFTISFTPIVGRSIHAAPPNTNQTVSTYGLTSVTTYGHPDSGIYTRTEGRIGWLNNINTASTANYTDFRWNFNTIYGRARSYFFYSGDSTATQKFAYPRVDLVDGNEPTIAELLTGTEPVRDLSPNGNVIYPLNYTNYSTQSVPSGAMSFDRRTTNGTPIIGGTLSATFSLYSMSVWFKPATDVNKDSAVRVLIGLDSVAAGDAGMVIAIGNSSVLINDDVISLLSGGGPYYRTGATAGSVPLISSSSWHNLAINWESASYAIYLDGVNLPTTIGTSTGNVALKHSMEYISIGGRIYGNALPYNTNLFDGDIGSVTCWGRSLTSTEIASNYNVQKRKYGII